MSQAERYLLTALQIAQEQEARSVELRVLLNLCDLGDKRQDANKYRARLRQVYDLFTEGFETTDLVKAKTMLDSF